MRWALGRSKLLADADKQPISVTVSAGVAALSADLADGTDLIRLADTRLYEAKESGRNKVCA